MVSDDISREFLDLVKKREQIENIAIRDLLIARNKLIEDLILELPESDKAYKKALRMRNEMWETDKEIWRESKRKIEVSKEN